MMFSLRLVFCLCLVAMIPLRATIGDSVAQCVKRYGKPIGYSEASPNNPFGTLVFSAAGFQLVVFLIGENEVGARISKTNKSAFTDDEMKNIMNAEGDPQSPWTPKTSDDPTCLEWTRADKSRLIYDKVNHILMVTSSAMADAVKKLPPEPKPSAKAPAATSAATPASTSTSGLMVP